MSDFLRRLEAIEPIEWLEAFVVDVNGCPRGKWISPAKARKLAETGLLLPRSAFALDIEGKDVEGAGLAFGTGDPDGMCFPVESSLRPVPWSENGAAQVLLSMEADGHPFYGDPRAMLSRVLRNLEAAGLQPTVAVETEFYLVRSEQPVAPMVGAGDLLSLVALGEQQAFLSDVASACKRMDLDLESILSENAPGQFEINISYSDNALKAADDAVLFKRCVKAIARQHGLTATFMAKPFGDLAGSGMHVHIGLLGADGTSVFEQDDVSPNAPMRHAIGGLLTNMADSMLAFAPHANSYRRFRANSHAPCSACWGIDDRTAAVRAIPGSPARIEHRVSGADANPYLVVALILAGVLEGIQGEYEPGDPQNPQDRGEAGGQLPLDWRAAISKFETSDFVARALSIEARDMITACKWQDFDLLLSRVSDIEHQLYLSQA